ncbi:MAG: hypothetical protein ACLSA6_15700 [Holdemania massiliensis]
MHSYEALLTKYQNYLIIQVDILILLKCEHRLFEYQKVHSEVLKEIDKRNLINQKCKVLSFHVGAIAIMQKLDLNRVLNELEQLIFKEKQFLNPVIYNNTLVALAMIYYVDIKDYKKATALFEKLLIEDFTKIYSSGIYYFSSCDLILILSFLVLYGCSSANPEKYETVQNEEIPLTIHDTILYEETSEKIFTITKLKDKRKIIDEMVLHQNGTEIQPEDLFLLSMGRILRFVSQERDLVMIYYDQGTYDYIIYFYGQSDPDKITAQYDFNIADKILRFDDPHGKDSSLEIINYLRKVYSKEIVISGLE